MRKDLLLGGKRVRDAESEALDFYAGKVEAVDRRVDSIEADLAEERATYDLALERVLNARDTDASRSAAQDAAQVRKDIVALDSELAQLGRRREELAQLTQGLEARQRERETLESRLDTDSSFSSLMFSLPGIGLAPGAEQQGDGGTFLADQLLIDDLLARDPMRARQVLRSIDPVGYWQRWPLRPPSGILRTALAFPAPDLPGGR